jgi:hypothetical protein
VLGGVNFIGSGKFSDFELIFAILLSLPLLMPFADFVAFPSSR